MIITIFVLLVSTILFIVFIERALRKILINYPKRQMGNKMYGGDTSHLPLKINQAGVIPAIFASALLLLPITFSNFNFSNSEIIGRFSPNSGVELNKKHDVYFNLSQISLFDDKTEIRI